MVGLPALTTEQLDAAAKGNNPLEIIQWLEMLEHSLLNASKVWKKKGVGYYFRKHQFRYLIVSCNNMETFILYRNNFKMALHTFSRFYNFCSQHLMASQSGICKCYYLWNLFVYFSYVYCIQIVTPILCRDRVSQAYAALFDTAGTAKVSQWLEGQSSFYLFLSFKFMVLNFDVLFVKASCFVYGLQCFVKPLLFICFISVLLSLNNVFLHTYSWTAYNFRSFNRSTHLHYFDITT